MDYARRTFDAGWLPDADAINAPPNALLRADNLVLDELGVVALRLGSTKVNPGAPLSETDVHTLFTIFRDGSRVRYAGAGNKIFRQAVTPLGVTMNGSGDVAFGSHMGQVFFARGDSKYKDDGTTVRNWGIEMTGGAPVVTGSVATDTKEYASWDQTETADHVVEEDNGAGLAYAEDRNGDPAGAIDMFTNENGRIVVRRDFSSPQDFSVMDGATEATDDDILKFWFYTSNPSVVQKIILQIDVNGGTFAEDYYLKEWAGEGASGADGSVTNPGTPDGSGGLPGDIGPGEPPLA